MPQPQYRLTDAGKRLYWLYRGWCKNKEDEHLELTSDEFIVLLASDAIELAGYCLSCGDPFEWLTAGMFCNGCIRSSYKELA